VTGPSIGHAVTDLAGIVDGLDAGLRAAGTPERAVSSKAYLKSDLEFYGTAVPDMRAAVRALRRTHPGLTREDVLDVAGRLWARPVFERRLLAVLLLEAHVRLLTADDLALLERWVRLGRMWALVDNISGDVAGPLLDRIGEPAATTVLDAWAADGDVWVRRSALLAHNRALRAGGGDWARFARYADAMLQEREFWIRKAIGWVLRDMSRGGRPDLVFEWLLPRAHRASGVTLREAVKYLTPDQRAAVKDASGKRPGKTSGKVRSRTRSSG
jgi:3-methyladenine DNA glycosylase AlkD